MPVFNPRYKLVAHCSFSIDFYFIQSISLSLFAICISFQRKLKFYSANLSRNLVSTIVMITFIIKSKLNWFEIETELKTNYFLGITFVDKHYKVVPH